MLGLQLARFAQRAQGFEQKQRVPGGGPVQPPGKQRRVLPGHPGDQPLDLRLVEFAQRQPGQLAAAFQVAQQGFQLGAALQFRRADTEQHPAAHLSGASVVGASGRQDGAAQPRVLPDQPGHHSQGGRVEPVQVFDHQHAAFQRGTQGRLQGQLQGSLTVGGRLAFVARQQVLHAAANNRVQALQQLRLTAVQGGQPREGQSGRLGGAVQRQGAGLPKKFTDQPGLADARLAGHEHHPRTGQGLQGLGAAHQRQVEGGGGRLRERRLGVRLACRFACGSAGPRALIQHLVLQYLAVECRGLGQRLDPQFAPQQGFQSAVAGQGGLAFARSVQQAHQLAVGLLAQRIEPQHPGTDLLRGGPAALPLEFTHPGRERAQFRLGLFGGPLFAPFCETVGRRRLQTAQQRAAQQACRLSRLARVEQGLELVQVEGVAAAQPQPFAVGLQPGADRAGPQAVQFSAQVAATSVFGAV